jgi:O-antigen/teichoic acid export membrane protein
MLMSLESSAPAEGAIIVSQPVAPPQPSAHRQFPLERSGLWVIVGRSLGISSTALLDIVLARLLTSTDFGDFAFLVSVIVVGSQLAMFGVNMAVVRLVTGFVAANRPAAVRSTLLACGRLLLILGPLAGLIAAAVLAGWDLLEDSRLYVLAAVAICVPLRSWQQVAAEASRALGEQRIANLFAGGALGGPLVLCLVLAFILFVALTSTVTLSHVMGAVAAALGVGCACAVMAVYSRLPSPTEEEPAVPRPPVMTLARVLHFGAPLLCIQLAVSLIVQSDLWIVGTTQSAEQLALYAAARRLTLLIGIPLQMATLTVSPVITPLHAQARFVDLQRTLGVTAGFAFLAALVAIIACIVAGPWLLAGFFGAHYRPAYPLLVTLCAGQLVRCWTGCCGVTLIMTGHHRVELLVNLCSGLLQIVLGTLAAHYWGTLALAATCSAILMLHSLVQWLAVRRVAGVWCHARTWMLLKTLAERYSNRRASLPGADIDPR